MVLRPVVGIEVTTSLIRGAVSFHGRAGRSVEVARKTDLRQAIAEVLRELRLRRWPSASVIVTLGPHAVQVKHLRALPKISERQLRSVIKSNADSFFIRYAEGSVIAVGRTTQEGTLAAAFDANVVRDVESACSASGVRLRSIVPSVCLISTLLDEGEAVIRDGKSAATVTVAGKQRWQTTVARSIGCDVDPAVELRGKSCRSVGETPFALARAAVSCRRRVPLSLRHGIELSVHAPVRRRLVLATAVCAMGLLVSTTRHSVQVQRHLNSLRGNVAELEERAANRRILDASVHSLDGALREAGRVAASRGSVLRRAAEIAQAIPDTAAILELQLSDTAAVVDLIALNTATVRRVMQSQLSDFIISIDSARPAEGWRDLQRITVLLRDTLAAIQSRSASVGP